MRIRIQALLPLTFALIVAVAFGIAAGIVGGVVRDAMLDGVGPGAAAGQAARAVLVSGALAALVAGLAGALLARMITAPLSRMRRVARRLADPGSAVGVATPVAEIQDVARGFDRVAEQSRGRHARELQERTELAALLETVSEGIVQLGADGRIRRANRAARSLLGLPPDMEGRPVRTLVRRPELRLLLERAARGELAAGEDVLLDERRLLVAVADLPEGGAVATLVDLTELRRLEEVRRDFVANASHELKSPLTSIRGYAETLLEDDLAHADRREFLATIARNAERLQRIVDDLLDLSRIESGRWQPELETVDLAGVAESAWRSFARRADSRGVAFRLDATGPTAAVADRRAMEQVFANLFDNAIRHTGRGGQVRVALHDDAAGPPAGPARRLAAHAPARTGPWLRTDVADTGGGIPRDALPRIFERFYRVDPARSRAEGGTGLGLSIVRHMVENMGGAVAAESELGKGTTIRVWLRAGA